VEVVGTGGGVLIASADARARSEIARLLNRTGYETSEFSSGERALAAIERDDVSLVLLDLELDDVSGYEICHELRERFGEGLPIIFLSSERTEASDRVAGLLIGADDYVTKPFAPDELLARARRLIARTRRLADASDSPLTGRETQVLQLLADGMSQERIAQELFISPKTVGSHVQRILTKLGVHSRTEAVALAYRGGLMVESERSK